MGKMHETYRPAVGIKEVITKSPNKSCDMDALSTWLLNKYLDTILHLMTAITNTSMAE